jgi:hypothetical protein
VAKKSHRESEDKVEILKDDKLLPHGPRKEERPCMRKSACKPGIGLDTGGNKEEGTPCPLPYITDWISVPYNKTGNRRKEPSLVRKTLLLF